MTTEHTAFEIHLGIISPHTHAVDVLSSVCPLSKKQIKQAMGKGAVWLTHQQHTRRLRRFKTELIPGDQLHFYYNEAILNTQPLPSKMIKDYQSYSIWYKPYGTFSQGSKWGDHCTINRWVEQHTNRPGFIVHRLDRATTGLMIIAHSKRVAALLSTLFSQHRIEKRYLAVVHGKYPATDTLTINSPIDGRAAISHITTRHFNADKQQSLVEVHIETGRKHQIRKHLSEGGFPIVGDRLYGQLEDTEDLMLCCYRLRFSCPLTDQTIDLQLEHSLQPALAQPD